MNLFITGAVGEEDHTRQGVIFIFRKKIILCVATAAATAASVGLGVHAGSRPSPALIKEPFSSGLRGEKKGKDVLNKDSGSFQVPP